MLLMIDNYDSFTYNLVQYFAELGQMVETYRNDAISIEDAIAKAPEYLVISPGPCTPNEAGISIEIIKCFAGKIPILGVCLGHQSIVQAFGGKITYAKNVMHGKTSLIFHTQKSLFSRIENPVKGTRYHSLIASKNHLPECLIITAWTKDNSKNGIEEIMGIMHKKYNVHGVQFHPESILTHKGKQMLKNFLKRTNA